MSREIREDGDRWRPALDSHSPHPGSRAVVFYCTSNAQRPYRVAEVAAESVPSGEALDQLSEGELDDLFRRSQPLDYTHDPRARAEGEGTPDPPPPAGARWER